MDSHAAPARMRRHTVRPALVRLLAETAVAVQHTLGLGDEEDDRALDYLERSVWLELACACPDRREREYLIERARRRACGGCVRRRGPFGAPDGTYQSTD
jgi:hypothetical protein